jgi:beta-lactam-binding protein with PASTA domain
MLRAGPTALIALALALVAPCALASCSSSPGRQQAVRQTSTTTAPPTTTTSSSVTTTTITGGVAVPNVIGLKIDPARYILHAVGFGTVPLNTVCSKGTLASQSVVASLSVPGHAPFYGVGATPLIPGTMRPKRSLVAITWSDCYPNGTSVPAVVGLKFIQATHHLHAVGLTWSCFSMNSDPATTDATAATTAPPPATSSSTAATTTRPTTTTTTTAKPPKPVILTQSPTAGAIVKASTTVTLTMHACPQ